MCVWCVFGRGCTGVGGGPPSHPLAPHPLDMAFSVCIIVASSSCALNCVFVMKSHTGFLPVERFFSFRPLCRVVLCQFKDPVLDMAAILNVIVGASHHHSPPAPFPPG